MKPTTPLFWRSLLIQGAWNYQGMQHLGFLWALLPSLRKLPLEERRAALRRAAEFYNAHPYLCGYVLGAAARLEDGGEGVGATRLKRAALTPLGSVGDRLFWAGLRPLSGVVGMLALLALAAHSTEPARERWWLAVAVALAATLGYNALHLAWRLRALREGHQLGMGLAGALRGLAETPLLRWTQLGLGLVAGAALPLVLATGARGGWVHAAALAGVFVASWQLPAKRWALPLLLAGLLLFHLL